MTQYAIIEEVTRRVLGGTGARDPVDMAGPAAPPPDAEPGTILKAWQERLDFSEGVGVMEWTEGATGPTWRDDRVLADAVAAGVVKVDVVADTARVSVVGDPVRVKEYERAQQQAEKYRDGGFTGAVPSCVACWAAAKEWPAQQAAEDILAASARWLAALDGIRALRLQAKEDIRRATTNAEVDSILATFTTTLTAEMQGVQ